MKWLLWREYRLNRLILIVGAVLLFSPYLVALIVLWWPTTRGGLAPDVSLLFGGAATYSLIVTQLAVAFIGGNAMAGERADRSAEFMAYLPVSGARRLGAKLTLALSLVTSIWGVNLLVLCTVVLLYPGSMRHPAYPDFVIVVRYTAITGSVIYGVGWLISSFQSSPTFAVGGGLITPLLVLMGLLAVAWLIDTQPTSPMMAIGYTVICLTLAVVCFSTGTWYFLRRSEP